jgi:hypothetical protein
MIDKQSNSQGFSSQVGGDLLIEEKVLVFRQHAMTQNFPSQQNVRFRPATKDCGQRQIQNEPEAEGIKKM